jgi:hypothetical protein
MMCKHKPTSAHVTVACGWSEGMCMMPQWNKGTTNMRTKLMAQYSFSYKVSIQVNWHDALFMCKLTCNWSNRYTSFYCNIWHFVYFAKLNIVRCGPGSSVGIANAYRLDGLQIKSQWGWDFLHLSRPDLRPTQPPVQWVPGLSWE